MSDTPTTRYVLERANRRRSIVTLVLVAVLAAVAALPFGGAYDGASYQMVAFLAAGAVVIVTGVATAKRWLIGESLAAFVGVFFVSGAVAVNGIPTAGAFADLVRGVAYGWADLLSTAPPVTSAGMQRVVPFSAAFVGASVGCELARHTRSLALPAVGPLLTLSLAILFTPEERTLALIAGCVLAAGLLMLIRLRGGMFAVAAAEPRRIWGRLAALAIVLAVVVAGAPFVGPRLPGADARERLSLGKYQRNPFDPLEIPSPLVAFKGNLAENRKGDVVFSVTGTERVTRFPLATLSVFDGVVWAVADGSRGRQADEFQPVSSKMPRSPHPVPTEEVELTFTVGVARDPWLPRAGWVTSVESERDAPDYRLNIDTGTLAVYGGLRPGERFTVRSRPSPSVRELDPSFGRELRADAATTRLPDEYPGLINLFDSAAEGSGNGLDRIQRLTERLVAEGYYTDGADAPPGHSLGRLVRFLGDLTTVQGYGEQYAAAAAVLARAGGVPARVVVGYEIDTDNWVAGTAEVRAGDIAAWIEVLTRDAGWAALDVTPDKNRQPEGLAAGAGQGSAVVLDPPPPPPPPPALEPTPPRERANEDDGREDEESATDDLTGDEVQLTSIAVIAGAAVGVPLLLAVLLAALVVALKFRSSRRRRGGPTKSQVLGAWAELGDRLGEAGLRRRPSDTPAESVATIEREALGASRRIRIDTQRLATIAEAVNRAAYAPTAPDPRLAVESWAMQRAAVAELKKNFSMRRRLLMRIDPRPLARRRNG